MNNPTITLQLQGMRESIVNALVDYNGEITKQVQADIDRQIEAFDITEYIRNEVYIVLQNMVKDSLRRHINYQLEKEIADQVEKILADKLTNNAFPPSTKELDGLSSISYYKPYGKYREFDLDKDVFPGIPINITPVYILETEHWTFVWAFDLKREYVYEWDKVSDVYNSVKWRDRK